MKKYLFAALLLLTTGFIFAFTSREAGAKTAEIATTQVWYDFIGGDETLPQNYQLRTISTDPTCDQGEFMCAVKAQPHPTLTDKPDLSDEEIVIRRED